MKFIIAPKKAVPPRSPFREICYQSTKRHKLHHFYDRIQLSEDELKNLVHLMSMMLRQFKNQVTPPAAPDSRSTSVVSSHEAPITQNQYMPAPSIHINMPQYVLQFNHHEIPQYEEKVSARIDRETKDKVDELKRHLKKIERNIFTRKCNFNDLCIHPN